MNALERQELMEDIVSQAKKAITYKKGPGGTYAPDLNPHIQRMNEETQSRYTIHPSISAEFGALEGYIESKISREHLKLCAFYNKFFPSITHASGYNGATHNALPFTITEMEIQDAGTGISLNYLKAAVDTIVSRLKNIEFQVRIQSSTPLILLEMYKAQVERYFKSQIRTNRLEHLVTEVFHDSAILGYSHIFMDPWSKKVRKINDWELGIYESEFEKRQLKRVLIKDEAFPVGSLAPYIDGIDPSELERVISNRDHVTLFLYIDCFLGSKFVMIDNLAGPMSAYPFDTVLLVTYGWDIGVKRMYTTSLFDTLFPLQRQINKLCAKLTSMYLNYKGTVPVISTIGDTEVLVKHLSNQGGEVLIIPGASADVTKMIGQIDPIPLNPAFMAEIQSLKANMLELAGVQEISLDLGQLRSAAAVVALSQLRDTRFESQLFKMAEFVGEILINIVRFNAGLKSEPGDVPWDQMVDLIDSTFMEILPIHMTDPEKRPVDPPEDFQLYAVNNFLMKVINKDLTFNDIDYTINRDVLKRQAVNRLLRFKSMEGDFAPLEELCIRLFIQDIRDGIVKISGENLEIDTPENVSGNEMPPEDMMEGEPVDTMPIEDTGGEAL
jgi:hypothetical protein